MNINPFGTLKLVAKTVSYITTDQEKEGRELGINKAAEIYAPIFREADAACEDFERELAEERNDFFSRKELWKNKAIYYEKKKKELEEDVDRLTKSHPELRKYVDKDSISGVSGFYPIMDIGILADLLKGHMDEKRQKYFKIQFEESSKEWQEKISKCKLKCTNYSMDITTIKEENKVKMDKIIELVNSEKAKYEEVLKTYNTLKSLIGV